ncbi:conjugal transfer protein TrbE [Spirochaetia bacterium]|nr:conjugal transfer protein TrbE [Spirochaetia bacterium]
MSEDLLSKHLPWNYLSSYREGVVIQKDGILQRTFAFRGPDLEASAAYFVNDLSQRINDTIKRLGAGWAVQFEVQRFSSQNYPGGEFEHLAAYLIDKERETAFFRFGSHFESSYYLTFIYKPTSVVGKKVTGLFIQNSDESETPVKENIAFMVQQSNDIIGILQTKMQIAPLTNEETVHFLHSAVSTNRHYIAFPSDPLFLDKILPDQTLETSLTMKLGPHYIPIVGVCDFPRETYPAIFDGLNKALVEYRWVTRYICMDKDEGLKQAIKTEKAHRGNQTGWLQAFMSNASGEAPKQVSGGAIVKESDAAMVGIEIDTDDVALGYYTSNVMVWDEDFKEAQRKAGVIKQIINNTGFTCKDETFNALEAWKSMMPGQIYANYRSLPVVTSTLSHVIPLSSIWAGMIQNAHAGEITGCDIPHLICSSDDGTAFFLNLNLHDVGHTAIWGPTGAGKSTLLNLLEMQFFKYPASQVIVLDKGRSCRQPCMAFGGLFYEPGGTAAGGVTFQPLGVLEAEGDRTFAIEFIETLLVMQHITVMPSMSAAITDGISLMKDIPESERTLTTFVQLTNYLDPATGRSIFKDSLSPYCLGGKYGRIFDQNQTTISLDSRYIVFEMECLMNLGEACIAPALSYIFYFIERKFDGSLTMLVLDEAWLFLKHPVFQDKINEWLKTLRKKNVFVVFATQDVVDAIRSPLFSTVVQQCLTKIYLADPMAETAAMMEAYRAFGLTDAEISTIGRAEMKRDYFYTSPMGTRLFQLDLGKISLGIIGAGDQKMLDGLTDQHGGESGYEYCGDILKAKDIDYSMFMENENTGG